MILAIRCRCGAVAGRVNVVRRRRVVCYCDDCQLFALYLNCADMLDAQGGTDALIAAPGHVHLERGHSHVSCLRLSARGAHRWYAGCCNTPLGTTLGAWLPFVSLPSICLENPQALGQVDARVRARFARAYVPSAQLGVSLTFLLCTLWFMVRHFGSRRASLYPLRLDEPSIANGNELNRLRATLPTPSREPGSLDLATIAVLRRCG